MCVYRRIAVKRKAWESTAFRQNLTRYRPLDSFYEDFCKKNRVILGLVEKVIRRLLTFLLALSLLISTAVGLQTSGDLLAHVVVHHSHESDSEGHHHATD